MSQIIESLAVQASKNFICILNATSIGSKEYEVYDQNQDSLDDHQEKILNEIWCFVTSPENVILF